MTVHRYHHAAAARLASGMTATDVAKGLGIRRQQVEQWLREPAFRRCYVACQRAAEHTATVQATALGRRAARLVLRDIRDADPAVMVTAARISRRYRLAERYPTATQTAPRQAQARTRLSSEEKEALKAHLLATRASSDSDEQPQRAVAEAASFDGALLDETELFLPGRR